MALTSFLLDHSIVTRQKRHDNENGNNCKLLSSPYILFTILSDITVKSYTRLKIHSIDRTEQSSSVRIVRACYANFLPETLLPRNQRRRFCRPFSNIVNFVRENSRVSVRHRTRKTDDYSSSYLSFIRFAATTHPRKPARRARETIKTPSKTISPRTNNKLNFENTKHESCIKRRFENILRLFTE